MASMGATAETPLLEMCGIEKSFPGVHALRGVSLELRRGEVLALVGENGAGKSTLIKVLGGAHQPDAGTIRMEGRPRAISSPAASQEAGVSIIYQEFNLVPDLTVRENIFLGHEESAAGFLQAAVERSRAAELFQRIGMSIDLDARCRDLTVAQQQAVEIAKALSVRAKIIVMDEPTAALTGQEVRRLFEIISELKARGMGVLYISHRLEEIFEAADRVMVLRDGEHVGTRRVTGVTRGKLIELMVGRPLEAEFPPKGGRTGAERLRVENLSWGAAVRDVSFAARGGEILGLAGLVGAGRTETLRLIFGAETPDDGRVLINGAEAAIRSPRDAIRRGICLLPEDRKGQGLVLAHSVRENFGLPNLDRFRRRGFLDLRRERDELADFVESLRIRTSGPDQVAGNLSGGNQQKVVLAKWLARDADIVLFDEPTRGIDVGAKYEIYLLMQRLAAEGKAVVMVSSELPEILGMSDRIIVMHQGRVAGEITDVAGTSQEEILSLAIS